MHEVSRVWKLCGPEDRIFATQRTATARSRGPRCSQASLSNKAHMKKKQCFFKDPKFFHCSQIALYIVLNLYVFLYRIFMYLYVSWRIFMYLYVFFCFWRIFTYLYVSFKTVREDTYVSLRIFMYLSKPFRKIRTYLYVSLCIFSTGFERYIKIPKDTLRYIKIIKIHGWWNMSHYWIEKSRLAACVHHDPTWPNLPNIFFNPKSQTHFPAENRFRNALRHQNETTNATRSCASDPVSNAKILIFHVVSKIWQKNKEKVDNFRVWDFCSKKKRFS